MKNYFSNLRKEGVALLVMGILFVIFIVDKYYLHEAIFGFFPNLLLAFYAILFSVLWIYAGIITIRSLFEIAVGLSLLIFLIQSYCDSSVTKNSLSNQSFQMLLAIGLICLAWDFFRKTKEDMQKYAKKLKGDRWQWETILIYSFSILFVISFVFAIYEAIIPIIKSFCIYH